MTGAVHPINGLLLSRGEASARGRSQPDKVPLTNHDPHS
jgi:hypothetical protein